MTLAAAQSNTATATLYWDCGALVRGRVLSQIKRGAIRYGVELVVEETRGWIESSYVATVRGAQADVARFFEAVKAFCVSFGERP